MEYVFFVIGILLLGVVISSALAKRKKVEKYLLMSALLSLGIGTGIYFIS